MRWSARAGLLSVLVACVIASAPAWRGSWVYDDWAMAQQPAQDGWDDLLAVFSRDSSAYMVDEDNPWPQGVTYRPLSMATLIAVQAMDAEAPLAHHLVSLALHLMSVLGLFVACRAWRPTGSRLPLLIAAVFALHPVNIEAYGWINGRSDVLAGAFLAGLAWLLTQPSSAKLTRALSCALLAAGAALAKEPAVVAVGAMLLASLLPARGFLALEELRRRTPLAAATALGVVVALGARAIVTRAHVSGAGALLSDRELLPTFARAVTLTLEHLLVPLPRSMLCLSYELSGPTTLLDACALAAVGSSLIWLVLTRRYRSAVLLSGALVCMLPVLMVRHLVWLGFDRYLYLPLFLLCLACSDLPAARRFSAAWLAPALGLLALSSFATARAYASQSAWLSSLVTTRPDDPSGYIMSTAWFLRHKDYARAGQAALRAPRTVHSPALSHDLFEQLARLGHAREAMDLAERTLHSFPEASSARFDLLLSRATQRRYDESLRLAGPLLVDPLFCTATRRWLSSLLEQPTMSAQLRAQARELVASARCPTSGAAGK